MDKKELNHGYFLLCGFVDNLDKEEIERNYLLELQEWFIEQFKNIDSTKTLTCKPCHDSKFNGIDCLEMENKLGFYKSDADIRPGHAIWLSQEDAIRLYNLFRKDLIIGE